MYMYIQYTYTHNVWALETQQWSLLMITKPCVTSRVYVYECVQGLLFFPPNMATAATAQQQQIPGAIPNFVLHKIAFGKLKRVSRCNCRKLTFFQDPLVHHHRCCCHRDPYTYQPLETHACSSCTIPPNCAMWCDIGLWDKSLKGIDV